MFNRHAHRSKPEPRHMRSKKAQHTRIDPVWVCMAIAVMLAASGAAVALFTI